MIPPLEYLMLEMNEISLIWAPFPPLFFTFPRENPVNSFFQVHRENKVSLSLFLPKYGIFTPHLNPPKGSGSEADFTLEFSIS